MRASVLLCATVAALAAACSRDLTGKTSCNADGDCSAGFVCVSKRCELDKGAAGTMGGGGANGGAGGNGGTFDGGFDGAARMCPTTPVNACPAEDAGGRCEQTYCGGRLWPNSLTKSVLVSYRILDPTNEFSAGYKAAIRASANAWFRASGKFVTFKECAVCSGKFISVVPGDGDGIINALDSITVGPNDPRMRPRRDMLVADALRQAGHTDSARVVLQALATQFPANPRVKTKLDSLKR